MTYEIIVALVIALVVLQVSVPYVFVSGTTIDPDQVNADFAALGNAMLNRFGGTVTGTLAVSPGTTALPGLASANQASTGFVLDANAAQLSVAGAPLFAATPTQFSIANGALIVGAAGVSFYGNGLVNASGKIPDLAPAYFSAISASNFTTGTVPPARLGAGTPTAGTFLRGDSAWALPTGFAQYVFRTSAYTAALGEFVECTSGTFAVTLPTAVGNAGQHIDVKNTGTGVITVTAAGAELIDGAATYPLVVQYQEVTLVSNGVGWVIA